MKKVTLILTALAVVFAGLAIGREKPSDEHVKWMKDLGAQMGAMRKGVDVDANAKAMQATLKEVGKFWKARNSEVASKSCGDCYKGAAAMEKAVASGDKEAQMAAGKMIGAGCKGCHDLHREKVSDTENYIK